MFKKTISILTMLISITFGAQAQQTDDGRKVKRITFDREQVNIEYIDDTKDNGVVAATIKRDNPPTGITATKSKVNQSAGQWYTIDGRKLKSEPKQNGIYIMRNKNGVKKTIKK